MRSKTNRVWSAVWQAAATVIAHSRNSTSQGPKASGSLQGFARGDYLGTASLSTAAGAGAGALPTSVLPWSQGGGWNQPGPGRHTEASLRTLNFSGGCSYSSQKVNTFRRSRPTSFLLSKKMGKRKPRTPVAPREAVCSNIAARTSKAYAQILGVGMDAGDVTPSVMLFFDHRRFVFNVGEGFQRYCVEHGVRLPRMTHVFLTRIDPETFGGVPGSLITINDSGGFTPEGIHLYGPPPLKHCLESMASFMNVPNMDVHVHEFDVASGAGDASNGSTSQLCAKPFVDEVATVHPVILSPDVRGASNHESVGLAKRRRVADEQEQATNCVVCYWCKLTDIPGRFDSAKAEALGVPKDSRRAKLTNGESITLDSGVVINPRDVIGESTPGAVTVVLDCPTEAYIRPMMEQLTTCGRQLCVFDQDGVDITVIHLAPLAVVENEAYQELVSKLKGVQSLRQLFAGRGIGKKSIVFRTSMTLCGYLNQLYKQYFPLPKALDDVDSPSPLVVNGMLDEKSLPADNLQKIIFRPLAQAGCDNSKVRSKFRLDDQTAELGRKHFFALDEARMSTSGQSYGKKNESLPDCLVDIQRNELEVVFLGTGSAMPSKFRNVTGIYLNCFERGGILLDAGEGTFGQLCRFYGRQRAEELLQSLKLIWISHVHADHHIGLCTLLSKRKRLMSAGTNEIAVIGPEPFLNFIKTYEKNVEQLGAVFIDCWDTRKSVPSALRPSLDSLGIKSLSSFNVHHCYRAFGLVLEARTGQKGWKLAYSGDTRPCDRLVEYAKDCTLLIHEATFEDDLQDEAVAKRHSTTSEAIEIGQRSNAFRTILTHFSQRYPCIPVWNNKFPRTVGFAFDFMTVNLADLPELPSTVPALRKLFKIVSMGEDSPNNEGE